ncbi:MAG: CPBP family intramembrane glutamic endopeptidase [bacterium]
MKFLERAFDNENQIWKYILVIIIGFFLGQMVGGIPLFIVMVVKITQIGDDFQMPENVANFSAIGIDPNVGLVLMVIPFIASLIIGILLVKGFHRRNYKEVINGGCSIRWNRFWLGVIVWGALVGGYMLIDYLINPANFEVQFNAASFIPLVLISVLLIPIQSGTEEFFFRGYLMQGVAARTKSRLLAVLIPALIFALIHSLNPEVKEFGFWTTMPGYITFGLVFGIASVFDDGIEVAIGAHSINNVLSSIFVTSKSSAIQTPALLFQKEVEPQKENWILLILSILFIVILTYKNDWKFRKLFEPLQKPEVADS